jgi:hypothetical protein
VEAKEEEVADDDAFSVISWVKDDSCVLALEILAVEVEGEEGESDVFLAISLVTSLARENFVSVTS